MVYVHAPTMLARVLDVSLEERLQSRTSDLIEWAKIMLPIINQSAQLHTGHQNIRTYSSDATVAARAIE
jgi:hypothetical protein